MRKRIPNRWAVGVVALFSLPALAGCGQGSAVKVVSATGSSVLAEVHGRCPLDPRKTETTSLVCRRTKFGNAVSSTFQIPGTRHTRFGSWGLAWAYHCPKPGDFYVVVHLPSVDGIMQGTQVFKHGTAGHGYLMETNLWRDSYIATEPQWRNPQNLVVGSICTWHVRAVRGNAHDVSRVVPPIPPLQRAIS